MKLTISPVQPNDKNYIWQLFQRYMKDYIDTLWYWDEAWQKQHFDDEFANKSFLKLHERDKIVGYLQYDKNPDETYLYMIIIDKSVQQQGLGTKLLDVMQNIQPKKPLRLKCFQINTRAQGFYEKNGFRLMKEDEYYKSYERRL